VVAASSPPEVPPELAVTPPEPTAPPLLEPPLLVLPPLLLPPLLVVPPEELPPDALLPPEPFAPPLDEPLEPPLDPFDPPVDPPDLPPEPEPPPLSDAFVQKAETDIRPAPNRIKPRLLATRESPIEGRGDMGEDLLQRATSKRPGNYSLKGQGKGIEQRDRQGTRGDPISGNGEQRKRTPALHIMARRRRHEANGS
jgi:hypothetical protein